MRALILVAAASLFFSAAAHARKKKAPAGTPGQSGDLTFSSDSRLVLIDSIVTDRKGAYIGDLTRKDFRVREDGKEQTVTSFSYLADGAPDQQKHYLVLLFDNATVPPVDQHFARDAATKFIESNAGPGRLMSVVEFSGTLRVTQNLTGDVDRLKQAVSGAKTSVIPVGTISGISPLNVAKPLPDGLPGALGNLAKGLAKLPGRKTVVLFSEGLNASPELLKRAIEESNRANVAIYPADVAALARKRSGGTPMGDASLSRSGGTPPLLPLNSATTRSADLSALDDLSESRFAPDLFDGLARGTGGFVISSSAKLPGDLSRIGKEESQHYVLGYLPAKESQPGACHTIRVETDRSGASVRARTSYCDVETPDVQTGTVIERDLEARLSANAASTVHATMQTPFFYVAPDTARVDLTLDIPGAGMKFAKEKGRFTATVNVIGIAYLPDNGVAARFDDTRKITLDDQEQVNEFATRPWHFEKQFEMASGKFDLKVAFSSGAPNFGAMETHLTIDPWDPSKFLLSGLALSQTTHPASPAGLGEVDLSGDQVPLTANGVQFIPAGTNQLQKSREAFIYGEIYEPGTAAASLQLTVLDAKTGKIIKGTGLAALKTEAVPDTSALPFGIVLPADGLAPGSYTAQIDAQDTAGNRAVRRIDFELAP